MLKDLSLMRKKSLVWPFFIDRLSVSRLVQLIIKEHPQVPVLLNRVHRDPLDGNRGHWCVRPPQIHYELLCLCHIELQMIPYTPSDKVVHNSPVFMLITLLDAADYC